MSKDTLKSATIRIAFKLFLACCLFLFIKEDAWATGDAFRSSKHGALSAGQNRTQFGGVDRSVTGQWPPTSEAGSYNKGECTNCHEPHSSWGGAEPYPNSSNYPSDLGMIADAAAGPSPYLLFSDIFHASDFNSMPAFCFTCHERMTLNENDAGNILGWGYYGFYQGRTIFGGTLHILLSYGATTAGWGWPGEPPSGGASTIHARNPRNLPIGMSYQTPCLSCHSPHGVKAANSGSAYDTFAVPAARQTFASGNPAIPAATADYMIPHQLLAWEEALCENCHKAGSVCAPNIQDEINKRASVGGSGHPVDDTALAGRHWVNETLPITAKHVECYDCHNPHAIGYYGAGAIQGGKLSGMKYIDISGALQYPYPRGTRQPMIDEVCFKCHGDSYGSVFSGQRYPEDTIYRANSNLLTAAMSTDGRSNKRFEFNTTSDDASRGPNTPGYNSAFHPVAQYGRNTSVAICLQLQATYGTGKLTCTDATIAKSSLQLLTINCTDCHNNEQCGSGAGATQVSCTRGNLNISEGDVQTSFGGVAGPHGSVIASPALNWDGGSDNGDRSLLRDYYYTGYLPTTLKPFNAATSTTEFQNRFRLCFNCHDWNTFYGNNNNTNFYNSGGMGPNNLHAFHLRAVGAGMGWNSTYEACMTCHYNVHSNVQATNTLYAPAGFAMAPDQDSHLVNFAPSVVTGLSWTTPAWYYNGGFMNCSLTCHGVAMPYTYNCSHSATSNGVTTNTCNDT